MARDHGCRDYLIPVAGEVENDRDTPGKRRSLHLTTMPKRSISFSEEISTSNTLRVPTASFKWTDFCSFGSFSAP